MRWILIIAGVLVAAVAIIYVAGTLLPRDHVASTTARVAATPDQVYQAITDVERFPSWRAISKVEMLDVVDGRRRWREVSRFGPLNFEEVESDAPRHFVSRVVDPDQNFGGTWTWDIAPADSGTSNVTITERGYVSNPLFRFMSRFVFGHHATQEEYLRALGKKFGRQTTPIRGRA